MARGRPREFDVDKVLQAALNVFWARGYEGTTMADLGEATGLQPGSIYAAFGSKAGLFKQVADRYVTTAFSYGSHALEADSAREVVRRWLTGAAETSTGEATPAGCLLVQGALVTSDASRPVGQDLCTRRTAAQVMLAERFVQALDNGDLPVEVEARVAAQYVVALAEGIAVEAASGASRETLLGLVELSMRRLPWED
ncbi:TetR/AcrR family transcriptional regulator [Actinopolymorpha pittospori]|uniref:AcrR family transcriptional regulator n=1 Tax=Actinopolymorpha pittospori TaxID=648752 RepID=A0A927MWY7_9ACTN|nr:TetR/AcrR family transcriptional regulator [Actinopolymorpha pittospori]MBE1608450.1 AcrR family transcriptional regulator [Actinopolymorpha pittospori]